MVNTAADPIWNRPTTHREAVKPSRKAAPARLPSTGMGEGRCTANRSFITTLDAPSTGSRRNSAPASVAKSGWVVARDTMTKTLQPGAEPSQGCFENDPQGAGRVE